MDNTNSVKTFWQRPEGTTGKGIVAALLIGAGVGLYKLLPFLITLAENTIYLTFLIGVLAALWFILTSDRVHTLVFYAFQMISRAITSNFVDIDPVAILKSFFREMQKRSEMMQSSIDKMLAAKRRIVQEKSTCVAEMNDALRFANAAELSNNAEQLSFQTEKAGRRSKRLDMITEQEHNVSEILDALVRVKKVADYQMASSEDEMNDLITRNDMSRYVGEATDAAAVALGNTDKLAVRNMAADNIRERYTTQLGKLDGLIQSTKNVDAQIDLESMAFQADGKTKLAELRAKLNQVEGGTPVKSLGTGPVVMDTKQLNPWQDRLHSK